MKCSMKWFFSSSECSDFRWQIFFNQSVIRFHSFILGSGREKTHSISLWLEKRTSDFKCFQRGWVTVHHFLLRNSDFWMTNIIQMLFFLLFPPSFGIIFFSVDISRDKQRLWWKFDCNEKMWCIFCLCLLPPYVAFFSFCVFLVLIMRQKYNEKVLILSNITILSTYEQGKNRKTNMIKINLRKIHQVFEILFRLNSNPPNEVWQSNFQVKRRRKKNHWSDKGRQYFTKITSNIFREKNKIMWEKKYVSKATIEWIKQDRNQFYQLWIDSIPNEAITMD